MSIGNQTTAFKNPAGLPGAEKHNFPKYIYFENYAFKYLMPGEKIIEKFKSERAQFVKLILDNSKTAKTWTNVDIDNIVYESGFDRQRVLTALEYFHEKKWIVLQPKSTDTAVKNILKRILSKKCFQQMQNH